MEEHERASELPASWSAIVDLFYHYITLEVTADGGLSEHSQKVRGWIKWLINEGGFKLSDAEILAKLNSYLSDEFTE